MKRAAISMAIVAAFAAGPIAAEAATIYSNYSTGNDTTGDGSSGNPYKTFHKAYTSAIAGDTIDLTGTFTWTNADETGDVGNNGYILSKSLTIVGHGAGTTTIQSAATEGTATNRVFTISATPMTIRNMTIRHGMTLTGGCLNMGAGFSLTLQYVDVHGCRTTSTSGGALQAANSTTTIENSSFRSNRSHTYGGAVYSSGGSSVGVLIVTNSTFTGNNSSTTSSLYSGSAIFVAGGKAWLTNGTITKNDGYQGALAHSGATTYLKDTIVAGNTAVSAAAANADLYVNAGSAFTSNGYNIIGRYNTSSFATTTGDWSDSDGNGTFLLSGGGSGTLSLATSAAVNGTYGTYYHALETGSIGIDQGSATAHTAGGLTVNIPSTDQIGTARVGTTDIGAYEVPDTTAPVISSVASTTSDTTATITWTTDESSNSAVLYVATASYGSASTSATLATSHSISLSGLSPSTTYHFQVASTDASANTASSSDLTFATSAAPDTTAPAVSVTAPSSGASVSGSAVTLTASATDDVSVAGVFMYVDDVLYGSELTSSPYSTSWDSTAASDGQHAAFAVARDTSGNYATSTTVTFTVSNAAASPAAQSPAVPAGASIRNRVRNLLAMGDIAAAEALMREWPHLYPQAAVPAPAFARDLKTGSRGDDVKALQRFLIEKGNGISSTKLSEVGATGYFGALTRSALAEYQRAAGIAPAAGFFGPVTRAHVIGR